MAAGWGVVRWLAGSTKEGPALQAHKVLAGDDVDRKRNGIGSPGYLPACGQYYLCQKSLNVNMTHSKL